MAAGGIASSINTYMFEFSIMLQHVQLDSLVYINCGPSNAHVLTSFDHLPWFAGCSLSVTSGTTVFSRLQNVSTGVS